MASRFTVLLPVKSPGRGKSRLALSDRGALAHAFVLDAIAALEASPYVDRVLVICDEASTDFGVPVLPDRGEGDLNTALTHAAEEVAASSSAVAALLPDLPALRTADVDEAMEQFHGMGRWFVSDHVGSGTTMLAAVGLPLAPAFGRDSAGRHRDSGAIEVKGELLSLRLDVDTLADLHVAREIGVGRNTAAVLPRGKTPPQRGW